MKGISIMNNICKYFLLGSFLTVILFLGIADRGEALETDTAYWNEFVFKHKLNERLNIHLKSEQWFLDDAGRLGLYNFTPGAKYSWSEHVDFELNYKLHRQKLFNKRTTEHRIEIIPYLKGEWAGFKIELRNRFELRNIDSKNSWRLREQIQIKRNFKYKDLDFNYYISNEFFYDSIPNDFNQNRAKAGVSKEVAPDLNMGLYYMYWTIDGNDGKKVYKANVIGTKIEFLF